LRVLRDKAINLSGAHIPAADERSPYLAALKTAGPTPTSCMAPMRLRQGAGMPQLEIARIPDVYTVRCEYGVAVAPDADASVLSASCCQQQGRKF
jgi:hypothetical protein